MSGNGLGALSVLVIDDSDLMVRLISTVLNGLGITKRDRAYDGIEGWEKAIKTKPDLIIMDLSMPKCTGLMLTKRLRDPKQSPIPLVPIIMVSGHTEAVHVHDARDAGITEFLAKPITAERLYKRIVNVVNNPRAFVSASDFLGPDRRRRDGGAPEGDDRRKAAPVAVGQAQAPAKKINPVITGGVRW